VENCNVRQTTDDNTVRALCVLDKLATDKHAEYVILIALPRQQCFSL